MAIVSQPSARRLEAPGRYTAIPSGPMAAERAPRPLRDDIPAAVWQGFDRAIASLRPKIRGAFTRYSGLLQTAFTLEQMEAALRRDGNLEAIVSSPDAEELKRPAREELYDLYLGPRRRTRAERDLAFLPPTRGLYVTSTGVVPSPIGPPVFNAVRDQPAKAPVVRTMLATSKVAADTSAGIPRGWWNSKELETEMVRWAELNAAARVTSITDGTRAGIRQIVTSAFDVEDGTDRDGIARALRALDGTGGKVRLGLDAPRQKTLMKFIDDYPVIPPGTPARTRKVLEVRRQKAIDRRFAQLLKQRRVTIARTEALTVGNHGQDQTWRKAAADGTLDTALYVLIWITRALGVCPRCLAMRNSTREIEGGEFVSDGSGPRGVETAAVPDLHPLGYCTMTTGRRADHAPPAQPIKPTGLTGAEIRRAMVDLKTDRKKLDRRLAGLRGSQTRAMNDLLKHETEYREKYGFVLPKKGDPPEQFRAWKRQELLAEKADAATEKLLKETKARRSFDRKQNREVWSLLAQGKERQVGINAEFADGVWYRGEMIRSWKADGMPFGERVRTTFGEAEAFLTNVMRRPLPDKIFVSISNDFDQVFYSRGRIPPGRRTSREMISVGPLTGARTYVHELGHWIEQANQQWHNELMDLFARRTRGEKAALYATRTTGSGKAWDQITKADKWFDKYVGVTNSHSAQNSEMLSMALEWLYAQPFDFADKDPELFDLIVDLLDRD